MTVGSRESREKFGNLKQDSRGFKMDGLHPDADVIEEENDKKRPESDAKGPPLATLPLMKTSTMADTPAYSKQ